MNSNEVKIEKLNEKVEPQADTQADCCTKFYWKSANQATFDYYYNLHQGSSGCMGATKTTIW